MHLDLALHLPHDAASVPAVRRVCRQTLESLDVVGEDAADVLLALTEACANVVEHADEGHSYDVTLRLEGPEMVLRIADNGGGFHAGPPARPADLLDTSGRGLTLMAALVDELNFVPVEHGTTVELVKRLRVKDNSPLTTLP